MLNDKCLFGVLMCCALNLVAHGASISTLKTDYQDAIAIANQHQLPSKKLYVFGARQGHSVDMVTWTADHYQLGKQVLTHSVWTTIASRMRARCADLNKRHLGNQLNELLGMPPLQSTQSWHLVTMRLKTVQFNDWSDAHHPNGFFRPCFSGDQISQTYCMYQAHKIAGYDHWLKQKANAGGYPWTGLGYTYDWSPEAKSIVGLSEFVVPKGVQVNVISIQKPVDFC